jgi:hypothetical protein
MKMRGYYEGKDHKRNVTNELVALIVLEIETACKENKERCEEVVWVRGNSGSWVYVCECIRSGSVQNQIILVQNLCIVFSPCLSIQNRHPISI